MCSSNTQDVYTAYLHLAATRTSGIAWLSLSKSQSGIIFVADRAKQRFYIAATRSAWVYSQRLRNVVAQAATSDSAIHLTISPEQ